jgi:hypothetical protein
MRRTAMSERTRAPMPVIFIAASMVDRSAELLASFAALRPREGVVYWFGLELGDRAVVTTLVVPNADTQHGAVHTSAAANAEALTAIVGTPLVLLGQAHSHPGSNVCHSAVDDRETFCQFPGALSVVVPFFGFYGAPLAHCGIHRYVDGKYHPIPTDRVSGHLIVLPDEHDFRRLRSGDDVPAPWLSGSARERLARRTTGQEGHSDGQ